MTFSTYSDRGTDIETIRSFADFDFRLNIDVFNDHNGRRKYSFKDKFF